MRNLILTLLAVVFVACNNNAPTLDVQGKWKLMEVKNARALQSTDLSTKDILFDFGSSTVKISGNDIDTFYIANGEYPYTLQMANSLSTTFQSMTLTLQGTPYLYKKNGDEMTLDNTYVDGDKLTFSKQ